MMRTHDGEREKERESSLTVFHKERMLVKRDVVEADERDS